MGKRDCVGSNPLAEVTMTITRQWVALADVQRRALARNLANRAAWSGGRAAQMKRGDAIMEQAIIESMPNLTPAQAVERRNTIVRFVRAAMKDGTDYGVIPGTEKKTLYKPGAEKLCTLFGLSWRLIPVDQVMDWTGKEHDGEPFFWFSYRCQLQHGGIFVGESEGSCSSWEKKYRYRQSERKCPTCGKAAIIKGKAEYGGGWLCFAKKGGCNAKFLADDKRITEQAVGQIKNPDIHDLVNTIQKMAEKRAFVGSTVLAVNASEFFSGDIGEIDYTESELEERDAAEVAKKARTAAEVQAKMQAASKSLRGDQGDDDLVAQAGNTRVGDFEPDPNRVIDMSNIEEIPYQPDHMPIVPQAPEHAKPAVNGKSNAKLKFQPFVTWCNEWVANNALAAVYAKEDGKLANMYHILGRVAKLGYAEVTEENIEQIKTALTDYVAAEA